MSFICLSYELSSIIAVHGLGGHWRRTWTSRSSQKNWLEDFLPGQLEAESIANRVLSYGYDSDTAFTKAVTDIDDAAGSLLDRMIGERQSPQEKLRPTILVAHSLGGIVVKKVRESPCPKRRTSLKRSSGYDHRT